MALDPATPFVEARAGRPVAGWAACLGFVGIVAVSLAYVLSPPASVLPMAPLLVQAAVQGAVSGQATMRLIAVFGIPADTITAAACLLLGNAAGRFGRQMEALGWTVVGLASLLFLVIDTLAGAVLSPVAASGDGGGFVAVKLIFDKLFTAGTFAASLGALLLVWTGLRGAIGGKRVLAWAILLGSVLGLAASIASFFGFPDGRPMGLGVAIVAALLAVRSVQTEA